MNETVLLIIMAVVFALLGVMTLLGKADFTMKRRFRDSAKFNLLRLRVIHALSFLLVSLITILILCGVNEFVTVSLPLFFRLCLNEAVYCFCAFVIILPR